MEQIVQVEILAMLKQIDSIVVEDQIKEAEVLFLHHLLQTI
jgi:hypothetical protein